MEQIKNQLEKLLDLGFIQSQNIIVPMKMLYEDFIELKSNIGYVRTNIQRDYNIIKDKDRFC